MNFDREGKAFLGIGWKFPVIVDEATGRIQMSSYEEDIKEAIHLILMTRRGERIMRPEFGCGIQDYIFELMEPAKFVQMEQEIKNSLAIWEPRITDTEIKVSTDEAVTGKLNIQIRYIVRATNNPYNLVYPYYINEGFQEG